MFLNYKSLLNEVLDETPEFHPISLDEKRNLAKALYDMACDIDIICRENNIKMFLVGGSLLGAVRHGGFIPWDDDMDFGMSRADYNKFIQIFEEELAEKYELRCPNSPWPNGNRFMQVFKKGTVLKTFGDDNPFTPDSIYIDIFPYDFVPQNSFHRFIKGIISNFCMTVASCCMETKYPNKKIHSCLKRTKRGCIFLGIKKIIGNVFSFYKVEQWFNIVDKRIQYKKETKLVTSATGRKHYFGEIYNKEVFFPLKEMRFIEHLFFSPNDETNYLRGLYGDEYMIIPPQGKRESHFISQIDVGEV